MWTLRSQYRELSAKHLTATFLLHCNFAKYFSECKGGKIKFLYAEIHRSYKLVVHNGSSVYNNISYSSGCRGNIAVDLLIWLESLVFSKWSQNSPLSTFFCFQWHVITAVVRSCAPPPSHPPTLLQFQTLHRETLLCAHQAPFKQSGRLCLDSSEGQCLWCRHAPPYLTVPHCVPVMGPLPSVCV